MASKILVVEDDRSLIRALEAALKEEGFDVVVAHDGMEALRAMQVERPNLVILDLMLGWLGQTPARHMIQTASQTAGPSIIVLSTNPDESERALALNAGAEDYVSKPVRVNELLARVKAVQHRSTSATSFRTLRAGLVEVDLERWTVTVDDETVTLTAKEFGLLRMLLEAKGRVLTRAAVHEAVWEDEKGRRFDTRTVDIHVSRLRRKLGPAGRYIITVRGVGYRFGVLPDWI